MGLKYLLDTNSILKILVNNNLPIQKKISKGAQIYISIITVIEFHSNPDLSPQNKELFELLVERSIILDIKYENVLLVNKVINVRKKYRSKTPDAIIAAQAIINNLILITNDEGFTKIFGLQVEQL